MNLVQKWFIIAFQPAYMPGQIYFQYVVPREVEERPHTCYVCLFDRGFSEPSNPCGELITLGLCLERSILRAHGAVCFQS